MENKSLTSIGLAEDHPYVLKGLLENIDWKSAGMNISFAVENGSLAMEHIVQDPPDILITDIRMPGKNGLELASYIHEARLSTKVIILTAYDDFSYAQESIQNGVFDYLLKPVNYNDVIDKCRAALAERDQEDQIRYQIQKNLPHLQEKFLMDLMEGNLTPEETAEQMSFLGLPLLHTGFQCGIVSANIHSCSIYRMDENEIIMCRLKQDLLNFSLGGTLYLSRYRNTSLAFLFGYSVSAEKALDNLDEFMETIIASYWQKNSTNITVSLGRQVRDSEQIPASFKDALLVEDYRFRLSKGKIYAYESLPLSAINTDTLPFDLQDQVLRWVFLGDRENTTLYLEKLYQFFSDCSFPWKIICTFYLNVVLRLHFQAASSNLALSREISFTSEIVSAAESSMNLAEINQWLSDNCLSVCNAVQASYEGQYKRLVRQINQYINAHYSDQDLSLLKIAKHISMNPSYLSTVYKKNTGKGISDAITEIRLDMSKKMLISTDKLVMNIAHDIGFPNQYYFSAWFKKHSGCTPNEYRSAKRR